jgi:hypothetical protein
MIPGIKTETVEEPATKKDVQNLTRLIDVQHIPYITITPRAATKKSYVLVRYHEDKVLQIGVSYEIHNTSTAVGVMDFVYHAQATLNDFVSYLDEKPRSIVVTSPPVREKIALGPKNLLILMFAFS